MPELYTLTQTIHNLIQQLQEKGLEVSEVESDFVFYSHPIYAKNGPYKIRISNMREGDRIECHCFDRDNINKLLIELDLGENTKYKINKKVGDLNLVGPKNRLLSDQELGLMSLEAPKTQAKALSDKWFGMREENGQPIPSLWDSGEEGQLQVLTELIEVIKNNTYG